MHGSLRQLQVPLSSLQSLEKDSHRESPVPAAMPAGFDLLTLNMEHTVKTKAMASRQEFSGLGVRRWSFCRKRGYCPLVLSFSVCTGTLLQKSPPLLLGWPSWCAVILTSTLVISYTAQRAEPPC